MGVILQLPAPGVQHAEEPGGVGPQELRIGGELLDRGGGGLEQRAVADALMAADESAQLLGHREGEHEVVGGQLALQLGVQPGIGLVLLAAGTVAVAAAARQQALLGAGLTPIRERTAGRAATADDRCDHIFVLHGHARAEACQIGRAVAAEDLLNGAHDHRSPIRPSISA